MKAIGFPGLLLSVVAAGLFLLAPAIGRGQSVSQNDKATVVFGVS